MRYRDGARWHKWDLHVHSPSSLVQDYGAADEETWERFFTELEALPPEFKVIGINDYLFLDGYRRVLGARDQGRIQNLDLVLPVVELRLDKFGGSSHNLSRVNMHVIFSNTLDPDVIEQQFINALPANYQLSPQYAGQNITWSGVLTRRSLAELGSAIIASVPEARRHEFGPPLLEGFNNLNFSQRHVLDILEREYFRNRAHTAIGKTEWADVRWGDQSIAEKKTVVNSVDWVFTAAASPQHCAAGRASLIAAGVNSRLLDCSDAHTWASALDKDRLGQCYTWIHADTEFEGLRQALREPETRIFLGELPDELRRVHQNRTKYIKQVEVRKTPIAEIDEPWFDGQPIPINPGLVAIIGNKGSGKSALLDILGLLGDAKQQDQASFLSPDRFRKTGDNKARNFEGVLEWQSSEPTSPRRLDETVSPTAVERVTYVPQKLFELICNELESVDRGPFDLELKRVIFSHVSNANRLGHPPSANIK